MNIRLLAAITLASALTTTAHAAAIVIGSPTPRSENALPFGNANSHSRYQQIYGQTAFSSITGPISITSISFSAPATICTFSCYQQPQSISDGTYQVSFSTTSRAVGGLSTTFDSNIGADSQLFYAGFVEDTLTFTAATPFIYDPSLGSLLLDVTVQGQTPNGTYFHASSSASDQMSRMWGSGTTAASATAAARTYGLITSFEYAPYVEQSEVPEPATMWLLGGGLAALAATRRRKSRQLAE